MRGSLLCVLGVLAVGTVASAAAQGNRGWHQWGRDARHHGMAPVAGQRLDRLLADLVYDPFVEQARAEQFGILVAHYQVPLVDGNDVFMEGVCDWELTLYLQGLRSAPRVRSTRGALSEPGRSPGSIPANGRAACRSTLPTVRHLDR